MTDRDKCLKAICEADAAICNHPYTFPCTYIAQIVKLPVKKVRQIMRKLEENGLCGAADKARPRYRRNAAL